MHSKLLMRKVCGVLLSCSNLSHHCIALQFAFISFSHHPPLSPPLPFLHPSFHLSSHLYTSPPTLTPLPPYTSPSLHLSLTPLPPYTSPSHLSLLTPLPHPYTSPSLYLSLLTPLPSYTSPPTLPHISHPFWSFFAPFVVSGEVLCLAKTDELKNRWVDAINHSK